MTDEGKRNSLINRLKQSYRLIVLKDVTFAEVGSVKVTPLRMIILTVLAVLLLLSVYTAFIIYTPAKRLIPGYGELESNKPYVQMHKKVTELEKKLAHYQLYTESFRKMLVDSAQYVEDVAMPPSQTERQQSEVQRIPEDDSLRARVDINKDLLRIAEAKAGNRNRNNVNLDELYLYSPLNGLKSKSYNAAENHYGMDIIAPEGSSIKSVADGVVILAINSKETGYTIGIQHDNDLVTYYKHNSSLLKEEGDRVEAGEAIAVIGNTGELTSGPHLHFEMWYKGEALNPEKYVRQVD